MTAVNSFRSDACKYGEASSPIARRPKPVVVADSTELQRPAFNLENDPPPSTITDTECLPLGETQYFALLPLEVLRYLTQYLESSEVVQLAATNLSQRQLLISWEGMSRTSHVLLKELFDAQRAQALGSQAVQNAKAKIEKAVENIKIARQIRVNAETSGPLWRQYLTGLADAHAAQSWECSSITAQLGLADDAVRLLQRGVAQATSAANFHMALAELLLQARQYGEAVGQARRALALSDVQGAFRARKVLGRALLLSGDAAGAREELKPLRFWPSGMAVRAMVEHTLGNHELSDLYMVHVATHHASSPGAPADMADMADMIEALGWRGDAHEVCRCMRGPVAACDTRLSLLPFSPFMDPVRSDPRWQHLLRGMHRTSEQVAAIHVRALVP